MNRLRIAVNIVPKLRGLLGLNNHIKPLNVRTMSEKASGDIDSKQDEQTLAEMPYIVGHDKLQKVFYIRTVASKGEVSKQIGTLRYRPLRDGIYDLYSTVVDDTYQGQGIAKHLATAAMDFVTSKEGNRMKLTCSYLERYLKLNPIPRYYMAVVP
ncbi:protein NATD1-like isoform X1 [Lineus longissimus]|uniref:protein NATD1-like isoform X1 n=1 Tax=Lineus longissimus TaxID=88925 RepID=UPI00315DE336